MYVSLYQLDGCSSTFWSFPNSEFCSGGLDQPCLVSYAPASALLKSSVSQIVLACLSRVLSSLIILSLFLLTFLSFSCFVVVAEYKAEYKRGSMEGRNEKH